MVLTEAESGPFFMKPKYYNSSTKQYELKVSSQFSGYRNYPAGPDPPGLHFFGIDKAFYVTKILKYPVAVHSINYIFILRFQV